LEVPDEDSTQVGTVVDLVPRQVLEPCPCGVAKVQWQVLYDEEVVLEPYTKIGVPVVPGYVGQSAEARGEPRIPDALDKGPGPLWLGDQLRSWSSSLSWRRPRPRSSW
jgi:hypothetical protein